MSDITKTLVREAIQEAHLLGSDDVVLPIWIAERFRHCIDLVHKLTEQEIVPDGERLRLGEYTYTDDELRDEAHFLVNLL